MSRIGQTLALVLALAGCGDAAPPAIADAPSVALADRFTVGDVLRYRFDWRVDTRSDARGILPDDMQLEAGVALAGELVLRVYPRSDEGIVLGASFARLDQHAISMMGQNALPDASDLIGREVIAVVGDDGELRSVYLPTDAPPLLRQLMPGLLAQADLRLPARDAVGTREVAAGSGIAEVEYAWSSPTRLARTLHGYRRFDAFASATPAQADGRLEITVDDHGVPVRMEGDEVVSASDDREQQFSARTSFAFERVAHEHGEPGRMPALDQLARLDPSAPPDDGEAQRVLAQRFAKGLGPVDVELAVYAAASGLRPAPEFIVRATGRLRGWPELTGELAPMFDQFDDPRARSLVIDMLASAGTSEAQTLMCELLGTPEVRAQPEHAAWLQRFTFIGDPQPGTARFLLDEHALARDSGSARARQALLYPMGTVARRIAAVDPLAAAAVQLRLREELDATDDPELVTAALGGLGNAGAAADLERVLAHEHDREPGVRAAVASALRLQHAAPADAALVRLVHDHEPFVADVALGALDQRHGSSDDSLRLAALALGGDYPAELGGRLTSALLRRLHDDPWVRAAAIAMRTRTHDPRELQRIDDTLAAG